MICIEWSKHNTNDEIVTILHLIKNAILWPLCAKFHHQEATGSKSGGHIIGLHVYRPLYWCWHDTILWLNLRTQHSEYIMIPSNQQNQTLNHSHNQNAHQKWSLSLKAPISSCLDPPKLEFSPDSESKTGRKSPYMYHFRYPPWGWSSLYRVNFLHWHSTVTAQLTSLTQTRLNTKYIINIPIFRAVCDCVKEFTVKWVIRPHITCLIRVIRKNIN